MDWTVLRWARSSSIRRLMWLTFRMVSTTPTTSPWAFFSGDVLRQMGVSAPPASCIATLKLVMVSPAASVRSNGQRSVSQISLFRIVRHGRPTARASSTPVRASAGPFSATIRLSRSIVRTESGMLRRMSTTLRGPVEIGMLHPWCNNGGPATRHRWRVQVVYSDCRRGGRDS